MTQSVGVGVGEENGSRASRSFVVSMVLVTVVSVAGFVMLGLAWSHVQRTSTVRAQLPYVVSGGLAGLGLVGFAVAVLAIQWRRRAEAERRTAFGELEDEALRLVRAARRRSAA